jgi:hypothetical protein
VSKRGESVNETVIFSSFLAGKRRTRFGLTLPDAGRTRDCPSTILEPLNQDPGYLFEIARYFGR